MMTAIYIAAFLAAAAAIAGASTLFWRWWVASMPAPPHWQEAFRVVWCDVYKLQWERRPRVIWVPGEAFVCNGRLVAGKADPGAVTVAFAVGKPVSDTGFAHELRHEARRRLGVDPDGQHISGDWKPGGIVDQAQVALRERGW